jgi:hypothetical protein
MRHAAALLAAALISLVAYFALFGLVLERPLTVNLGAEMLEKKLAHAASTPSPKVFILAGSNARFSHSCAVLESRLERPCVNLGISADTGLDWIIDRARPYIRPGDVFYMPLEYQLYVLSRASLYTGWDAAYRFRHDRASLMTRGAEGIVRAAFMFSLPTLVHSVGEMALQAAGKRRRFSLDTLNAQGDETGHGDEKAAAYEGFVRQMRVPVVDSLDLSEPPAGMQQVIADFLDWCRDNGVIAVGGLQTIFDDARISEATVAQLKQFYARHGAGFIELDNRSQYPRRDFYDTSAHLRERAQRVHSDRIAVALQAYLTMKPVGEANAGNPQLRFDESARPVRLR